MGNLLPQLDKKETFIDNWHDCYVSDTKITGFICTFSLVNKKHRFYGLNDIQQLLIEAHKKKKDVYLSLNAFEYGSRKTKHLKQIRNIGVDIDCYKLQIPVGQALEEVKRLIFEGKIPNPNLILLSGRGIQLIYSISGGASPKMAFLSQYITAQYIAILQHLGADTSATDVTRVFRLPYSVNSKNNKQVQVDIWRTLEYDLEELYSYCTPLEARRKPSRKRKGTLVALPPQKDLLTLYSLNSSRKNDLEKLVVLRSGDIEKRNVFIYVYSYAVALLLKNQEATVAFAQQINTKFVDPDKKKEIERTAKNAYKDAMEFFEEFQRRDFIMWYQNMDGIKRPMKNETIIKQLDISPEEMRQFATIISEEEKQVRNTSYQRKKRREQGVKPREVYLEQQREQTDDKLWQLQQALQRHPNVKKTELAKMLGINRSHLYRLLKLI